VKVSILIPLLRDEKLLGTLLERVLKAPLPPAVEREILLADCRSSESAASGAEAEVARHPHLIRLLRSSPDQGRGAALLDAIRQAEGEFAIIQDADLGYDPRDYARILAPLIEGTADAVYGSRLPRAGKPQPLSFGDALANRLLTGICNLAQGLRLTDVGTGCKAFRMSFLQSIPIRGQLSGLAPEIAIKLAKREARICEAPIRYGGHACRAGKGLGIGDAAAALWAILRTVASHDVYLDGDKSILDAFASAPRFNQWMADTVRPYLGKSVLEIGSGMGNLTRYLVSERREYVATDIDREHLDRLRIRLSGQPNLKVAVADASRAEDFHPFHRKMDAVLCLNVLEHIEDDAAALRNIRSALRDGGRAIVLVPAGPGIWGAIDQALGHWRRYSEEELRHRMSEAGFAVETVLKFNRVSRPGWWFSGRVLGRSKISRFQLRNFDRMVWLFRKVDAGLPWQPTSLIAIGRRQAALRPDPATQYSPAAEASPLGAAVDR
jgi:SAM-dependent methyltransferase